MTAACGSEGGCKLWSSISGLLLPFFYCYYDLHLLTSAFLNTDLSVTLSNVTSKAILI